MSEIEEIKNLDETSLQNSWVFVEDCDVDSRQNKYYLNCSTEPVTEFTDTIDKNDLETDSDGISIISESEETKDVVSDEINTVNCNVIAKRDEVSYLRDDSSNTSWRFYIFALGCLLLALFLPTLFNYVIHSNNNYLQHNFLDDYLENDFIDPEELVNINVLKEDLKELKSDVLIINNKNDIKEIEVLDKVEEVVSKDVKQEIVSSENKTNSNLDKDKNHKNKFKDNSFKEKTIRDEKDKNRRKEEKKPNEIKNKRKRNENENIKDDIKNKKMKTDDKKFKNENIYKDKKIKKSKNVNDDKMNNKNGKKNYPKPENEYKKKKFKEEKKLKEEKKFKDEKQLKAEKKFKEEKKLKEKGHTSKSKLKNSQERKKEVKPYFKTEKDGRNFKKPTKTDKVKINNNNNNNKLRWKSDEYYFSSRIDKKTIFNTRTKEEFYVMEEQYTTYFKRVIF